MKCRRIINNNGINSVCYFKSIGLKDSDPIKIEIDPYVAQDPTKEYELKDIKTSSVLEFKVNLKPNEYLALELCDKTDGIETILYGESRSNDTLNPNTYTFIYNVKYKFYPEKRSLYVRYSSNNPHIIYCVNKTKSNFIDKDTYALDSDAVVESLNQRLSKIKGELWYQLNYGLPLFDKYKTKGIFDATIINIISEHPEVNYIKSYKSEVKKNIYTFDVNVVTIYNAEINLNSFYNF